MKKAGRNLNKIGQCTRREALRTLTLGTAALGVAGPAFAAAKPKPAIPSEIVRFIKDKEAHGRALEKKLDLKVSPEIWSFIQSAATNDPAATGKAFEKLKKGAGQYEGSRHEPGISTPVWQVVIEIVLAVEACERDPKYAVAFGRHVVSSLPRGSIYFGGTDPGRGLPTALSKSHAKGDPILTLTQNALADGHYLEYLRATYGNTIRIPTEGDSQSAFQRYLEDAQKRLEHDRKNPNEPRQIKPGEDVRIIDNKVQVSGQVAVMAINGLLTKIIFDSNPDREFYVEESFPLDWMFPHLSPHGMIFKLNRAPLDALSDGTVAKDRQFWMEQQKTLIGSWLKPETSVKDVCAFVRKVHVQKDYSDFTGDRTWVENEYARKMYSKLRSSIAGVYAWRQQTATSAEERQRMGNAADYAFRQAYAFCPTSPEAIFRYINILISAGRIEDSLRICGTSRILEPENSQLERLDEELNRIKRAAGNR